MNARGPGEKENLILLLRQMEPRPRAGCHRVALFSPEGPPARRRRERQRQDRDSTRRGSLKYL